MPKQYCSATVRNGYHTYKCGRGATMEHDGKPFCKQHHPPTMEARQAERNSAYAKQQAEIQAARNADAAVREAERAVVEAAKVWAGAMPNWQRQSSEDSLRAAISVLIQAEAHRDAH